MKPSPLRALVIDDMAVMRHSLMMILKHHGFETTGASEGRVALDLLARRRYDLILCDWYMPGMNGSELIRKIRALRHDTPIIMVTAEGDPERVRELIGLGVSGYVIKPFRSEVLMNIVRKLFPRLKT